MALQMKTGQVRFDSYGQSDARQAVYLLWFKRDEEDILAAIPLDDIHDKIGDGASEDAIARFCSVLLHGMEQQIQDIYDTTDGPVGHPIIIHL